MTTLTIKEMEELAAGNLERSYFDYYQGGAQDEITLGRNCSDFDAVKLCPRMLVDVSRVDMEVELWGEKLPMPILIAPTAFHCLAHPQGELATARAAASLSTIMTLSTLANHSIEEVAAAQTKEGKRARLWFQLYVYKDREITKDLLSRARQAGVKAIVLTVDSPRLGKRPRDCKNGFHLPAHLSARNLERFFLQNISAGAGQNALADYSASLYDLSLSYGDLEWIVAEAGLPVLVKGILRADDASRAVAAGAAGIIVSNHGGRQLDTALSSIEALEEVCQAVPNTPVLMDGGIRRGTDILKALALGAKAVLLGRPVLWGLAYRGEAGVQSVLSTLKEELLLSMQLAGAAALKEVGRDLVKSPFSSNAKGVAV